MNNLFKKVVSSVALLAMILTLVPTASFAATISDGDLVKASGSSAVYLIQDGKKRVFPHSSVYLSWGYPANYSTVKTVSADELSAYPDGDPVIYRDGFMFRFHGVGMVGGYDPSAVFYVSDGKIRPIESVTAYMKLFNGGVNESSAWDRVYWIPDDLLAKFTYPQGDKITASQIDLGQLPNGLVVRDTNSKYYVIKNGQLANITSDALAANRYTANANVFTKMLVTKLANSVLNLMPAGPAITGADPDLLTVKKISAQPSTTNVVLTSDKTSVEADGASYATLTALVPSTVTSVSFAITSGSGMLSAYTVTPVNGVATVRVTPTASSVSGTLTVSASATGLTSASVTLTTVANTLAPQVVSVSNQGMRLINVVFDKAVDKTSAETSSNYSLKNDKVTTVVVGNAKLLDDGKTVQLFLNAGFYNNSTEDSIEVKNVQNVAQNATMSTVTKLMTVTDTSVPTVVAVESLGSKALRVTFSEAVQHVKQKAGVLLGTDVSTTVDGEKYAAFKLDDKDLEIETGGGVATTSIAATITYPDANDYTKALITFNNPISVGAHTLLVSYNGVITDYNVVSTSTNQNPYTMQPAGYVATVVSDTSVPTLSSVEVLSQTKVRYTFSKPISTPANTAFFYNTLSNATTGTTASATGVTKVSDTVYEVAWDSAITAGTVYFYAGTGVTDFSGNTISPLPSNKMAVVVADSMPSITSVSMRTDSDKIIDVYFNKDVETSSATTSSNYVFKTSSGVVLTSSTGGSGIGSNGTPSGTVAKYVDTTVTPNVTNNKRIVITLGDGTSDVYAIPGGTYQLCITNVKAISGTSTSAMSTSCTTFVVTDKTRPTLVSTGTKIYAAKDTTPDPDTSRIVVKFSEAMSSSALNAANYKLTVDGITWTKLSEIPGGANLSFRNNNKDLIIDFPLSPAYINDGSTDKIMIGYIEGSTTYAPTDVNGNIFRDTTVATNNGSSQEIAIGTLKTAFSLANTAVDLKVTSPTTLEVTFDRDLDTISTGDFKVYNSSTNGVSGIQPSSAVIDDTDKNKVVFTIGSGVSNEFTSSDISNNVVKLATVNSTISTKDIYGLTFVANVSSDGKANVKNNIQPILKSANLKDSNTLVLVFDSKIKNVAANANGIALANNLVVSQTIGTTTTTITGYDATPVSGKMKITTSADSSVVTVTLGTALSTLDPVIVKTLSQDSLSAIGANGAIIAANTTGLTASSFVASTIVETLTAVGVANNDYLTISFNKNLNKETLISTGWTSVANCSAAVNTKLTPGAATDTCYTQNVTSGATFDKTTGKITFSGANVGEIYAEAGITMTTVTSKSSDVIYVYNETTKTLYVQFTTDMSANSVDVTAGVLVYTPNSSLQTTVGTAIDTYFKPVVTAD